MPRLNDFYQEEYNTKFEREHKQNKRSIAVFNTEGEALGIVTLCFDTIERMFAYRNITLILEGHAFATIALYCSHLVYTYEGRPNQNYPQLLMNCTGGSPQAMESINFLALSNILNQHIHMGLKEFHMRIDTPQRYEYREKDKYRLTL
jgi:hypothetical protein